MEMKSKSKMSVWKKLFMSSAVAASGYGGYDQIHDRQYIGYNESLEVVEHVEKSKFNVNFLMEKTPGITYEEVVYFYHQTYDPNLLQKVVDSLKTFLGSVNLASCQGNQKPPDQQPPPGLPGQPVPEPGNSDEVDWSYNYVHTKEANAITTAPSDLIAIIDTGVDLNHPDLKGVIVAYANYTTANRSDVTDRVGHGSWIAGAIAGVNGNGGMRGMTQAKLIVCKALDAQGGSQESIVGCMDFILKSGAKRANYSWGGPGRSPLIEQKMAQLARAGIRQHVAAGNESGPVSNPANYVPQLNKIVPGSAFAVRAIDSKGRKATFSNDGPEVTNSEPGVQMKSTCPTYGSQMGTTYCVASGTSMSTPISTSIDSLASSVGKQMQMIGPMKTGDAFESVK